MSAATGIYFDGESSARNAVALRLAEDALEIALPTGEPITRWPYAEIVSLSAPDHVLRVARKGGATLARLEIRDPDLMTALDERAGGIDRSGASDRRMRRKVVGWSLAAVVSMAFVGIFGVPAIATRLTPLVPVATEQRLGATIDQQLRSVLDERGKGGLECGENTGGQAGLAALTKLTSRLETAAQVGMPLRFAVLRRGEVNAFALPGGFIYVFRGLIERAETPDELAGVLAHEIGHVVNRDGTRAVLQAAGLSFLFGTLLGDFGGGGAVVFATRTVLQSSYSREAETAADLYGARLMAQIGGEPRALGAILTRIAGKPGGIANFLLDHPEAAQRAAAIATIPRPDRTQTLIDASEWAALKQICAEK
jgi:Zn-dependent protease with chaperone function